MSLRNGWGCACISFYAQNHHFGAFLSSHKRLHLVDAKKSAIAPFNQALFGAH
jgi:hypothetical protein